MIKNVLKAGMAAGLTALTLAACQSGSDSSAAAPSSAPASVAAPSAAPSAPSAPSAAAPANGAGGAAAKQGAAVKLALDDQTRSYLGDTFYAKTRTHGESGPHGRDDVIGPEHVYYGKIAGATPAQDVYWAVGDTGYRGDPMTQQDGPHVWKKAGTGGHFFGWTYLGDSGGNPCGRVPLALIKVWGGVQSLCPGR